MWSYMGERQSWRAGADCKSVAFGLSWFKSNLPHQSVSYHALWGTRSYDSCLHMGGLGWMGVAIPVEIHMKASYMAEWSSLVYGACLENKRRWWAVRGFKSYLRRHIWQKPPIRAAGSHFFFSSTFIISHTTAASSSDRLDMSINLLSSRQSM